MRKTPLAILGLLLLSIALAGQNKPLNANPDVRSVHGIVTDVGDNPVKGAVVYLEDTKTLQIRSFVSGGDGDYHFAGLSANVDYKLHAEHNDHSSATKTLSNFSSKKDAVIDLKLR